jgi:UDP-sulfoquinovose synthase
MEEGLGVARKYARRVDRKRVAASSAWTRELARTIETDPEARVAFGS